MRLALVPLVVLLAACGAGAATKPAPTIAPTIAATTRPATTRPATKPAATVTTAPTKPAAPTPTAAPELRSLGLGRPKADWERANGTPTKPGVYADGAFYVQFVEGRVAHLERLWGDRDPKTRAFVGGALATLLPADKALVGPVESRGGTRGELYTSASLARAFSPAAFAGGEPGQFVVLYRTNAGGGITSAVAALGNNP